MLWFNTILQRKGSQFHAFNQSRQLAGSYLLSTTQLMQYTATQEAMVHPFWKACSEKGMALEEWILLTTWSFAFPLLLHPT